MKTKKKAYSDARDTKDSIKQPLWQADEHLTKYLEKRNPKYYRRFCLSVIKLYLRMRSQLKNINNDNIKDTDWSKLKQKIGQRQTGKRFKPENFGKWMNWYETLQDAVADIGITQITKTEVEYDNLGEALQEKQL